MSRDSDVRDLVRVVLPGGRHVTLRPIGDEDEAFVLDTAGRTPPSARATALLGRLLDGGAAAARALPVGDREALLLHLRRIRFGDSMDCVLRCPSPSCGEALELALTVGDLLVPPSVDVCHTGVVAIDAYGAHYAVSFRAPTAGDLEDAAPLAAADAEAGARALLARCVQRAERNGAAIDAAALPSEVSAAIGDAMASSDPQAELQLAMQCPACGAAFSSLFDTASFFLRELDERATRTLREVHTLAEHYHWSESDILQMPPQRRAQYIDLVRDARARGRAR